MEGRACQVSRGKSLKIAALNLGRTIRVWCRRDIPFLALVILFGCVVVAPTLCAAADGDTREWDAAQYQQLQAALGEYRALAARSDWVPIPESGEIDLLGNESRLPALVQRLALLGDLETPYEDVSPQQLIEAVRRFQRRNGLDVDARVGRKTLAALNVTPMQRAARIEANVERWRPLVGTFPRDAIIINVAAATLDLILEGKRAWATRVIVGDVTHQTPMFTATVKGVTFNPPWNVPQSIAVKEILPKLKRSPRYLMDAHIQILERPDDPYGLQIDWSKVAPEDFKFRLRGEPGPKNALGQIKFEMPNAFDVYIHDTPQRDLFTKSNRALSHGCVRVEAPGELAVRVLDAPGLWTTDAVADAIETGTTRAVNLDKPLQAYFLYFTAFVDDAGALNFRDDLYGRDRTLAENDSPADSCGAEGDR